MPINILMPALSPTMEKGNLAKWLKKEGDTVKSGDVIAEIETDKATMEVEAVDEGTLAKIVVPEGTADVPVNQVIAVLAGEGEDVKAAARRRRQRRARAEAARLRRAAAALLPRRKAQTAPQTRAAPAAAAARSAARGRAARAAATASSPRRWRGGSPRKPASTLRASPGSGPHGRVIARDVDAAKSGKGLKAAGAARPRARRPPLAPALSDEQDPRAVRGRQLRGRAARQHAPDHRAAPDRSRRRPSRISI